MTILCPKCTAKVDSYYKFCPKCGSPLASDAEKPEGELVKGKKPFLAMLFLVIGGLGTVIWLIAMAGANTGMTGNISGSAGAVDKSTDWNLIFIFIAAIIMLAIGILLLIASGKRRIKSLREQAHKAGYAATADVAGAHFCNKCGADLPQSASYCVQCGRLAPEMPVQ